jgi:hypothetical protein
MAKSGKQTSGAQKYRCCRGCKTPEGKAVVITDSDRPAHRPVSGRKSRKEYREAWKLRDPVGYAESQKRRNAKRYAKIKALKVLCNEVLCNEM